ncbi:MAG: ribosome recycling factor [Chlamydiales bacterium]|nr:ribosome recycling factor [Chlamydiales bacterium]
MDILQDTKNRMQQALDHFREDLKGLRAGRASPNLLEPVMVEVYGSQMKLKELATITAAEARQLVINPFDATNAQAIARAIDKANLGVRAVVEAKSVRVMFPELTSERRKDLISQAHKKREDCKVTIRTVRRDANELVKKAKSTSVITEDDVKRLEKQIQELTDKSCKDADDLSQSKEKEISTI